MLSLHQLKCFLAAYEQGSLTAAAEELGYAQPSVSEQIRNLEKSLGTTLFRRVGRGVVPTTVADRAAPHAERTSPPPRRPGARCRRHRPRDRDVRFGDVRTARLYAGASLVADVLGRHPVSASSSIGQNSTAVLGGPAPRPHRGRHDRRTSRISARACQVTPVARDELVYISTDPSGSPPPSPRTAGPASLVMPRPPGGRTTRRGSCCVRCSTRRATTPPPGSRSRTSRPPSSWSPWASWTQSSREAPPSSCSAARPRRGGCRWAPSVRHPRDRAPGRRHALARSAADDRPRHPPDPGHRRARARPLNDQK